LRLPCHSTLHQDIKTWFEQAQTQDFARISHSYDRRVEAGHHRWEKRQVWAVPLAVMGELYQSAQ
jgi:hypothetical protein